MANHTVNVSSSAFYDSETGWFYSSNSTPATLDITDGDTVTWVYSRGSNGSTSVSIGAFDAGEWNSTTSATLTNGQSVVRTYTGGTGGDTVSVNFTASGFNDKTTVITSTAANAAPLASLTGDTSAIANNAVSVDAGASIDPDGDSLTYAFEVKKNSVVQFSRVAGTDPTWSYTPTASGTYVTTVTVSDSVLTDTATLTTTVYTASGNSGSGGGYGFEVFDSLGNLVLDHRTMLVRYVGSITTNVSGAGSTVVSGVTSNSVITVPIAGNDAATYSITGSGSTRTVSITNGAASSTYTVSMMR